MSGTDEEDEQLWLARLNEIERGVHEMNYRQATELARTSRWMHRVSLLLAVVFVSLAVDLLLVLRER